MNGLHGVQKLECDGVSAQLCNDCERPKVSLCEFPQGPSGVEVLGFDESLVTDFEVQCQSCLASTGPWYHSCVTVISSQRN